MPLYSILVPFSSLSLRFPSHEGELCHSDLGGKEQWVERSPLISLSKHFLPTRNLGKGREGPLSLDQTPTAWEEMRKWGTPERREEPQREKAGLFSIVILGAPWTPPAPWTLLACPAISAPPRQRIRLPLAVLVPACTECPLQPLRSRSPSRAPAPPGSGGARVGSPAGALL